ncbi:MAG TPA: response regulator [Gemmataceae bacterium]|jgi:DNA-binding NtrC family response regulator|nr:response regulator [Gemmataceae bacterium]
MTGTQQAYSILITDDDRGVRETLAEIVEAQGFRPVLAANGEEALQIVEHEPVHLALLDMQMPKLTGLETLQLVRQIHALLPAILITADATRELMRRAFDAQVFSVVPKPVNAQVVVTTVVRALVRVYGTVDEPPQKPDFGEPTK